MSTLNLGRMLVIANPAARSGKGEGAVLFVTRFFSSFHSAASSCEVRLTEGPADAQRMASRAVDYDTVVALGGDGVIHEIVNGLMMLPKDDRPRLGVIPMGSGNDFARTLGITKNDPERSIAEMLGGYEHPIDLGRVNGTYFMQTLSFGLDAAIALDTTARRANDTVQSGALLFATSGMRIFATNLRGWPFTAVVDGEEVTGHDVVFAVQNGPTYGGGFRICPQATPADGMLDLCATVAKPSVPRALALFGLARIGRHVGSRQIVVRQAQRIELSFEGTDRPPCQIDGEEFQGQRYVIEAVPRALQVIVPRDCSW